MTHLEQLPEPCVATVLQHLDLASLLRFMATSRMAHTAVASFLALHPMHLDLSSLSRATNQALRSAAAWCKRIVELTHTSAAHLRQDAAQLLSICGPTLRVLCLRDLPARAVSPSLLQHIGATCPHLALLDLQGCAADLSTGWSHLPSNITSLNLRDVNGLGDQAVTALAARLPNLEECDLGLSDGRTEPAACRLQGEAVAQLLGPRLRSLLVQRRPGVGDELADALATKCPQLQQLNMSNTSVSAEALLQVARACPSLKQLQCACPRHPDLGFTDSLTQQLAQAAGSLELLDASQHTKIGDASLAALASGCPQLQHLRISRCKAGQQGVCALLQGCKQLRRVEAVRCSRLGPKALQKLRQQFAGLSQAVLTDGSAEEEGEQEDV